MEPDFSEKTIGKIDSLENKSISKFEKDNFLSNGFIIDDTSSKKQKKFSSKLLIFIIISIITLSSSSIIGLYSLNLLNLNIFNKPEQINYTQTTDKITSSTNLNNSYKKKVTVPDIINLDTEKAKSVLSQFNLIAEPVKNPDDPDTVNTTYPSPGTTVDEGTTVKLYYLPINKY